MVQPAAVRQNSPLSSPSFNFSTFVLEVLIVIFAGIFAASVYTDFDPLKRVGGVESEYLTRTAYTASTLLRQKGYIPLWDPYMETGDPMLENPVAFAFNPVLIGPSLLFGPYNGIKISILLSAILAGLGGWALARVLGLGALGRLLLALLCIGKGNMASYLSQGHFALFASQVYFPWIFAGIIGIFRGYSRWPVIMTAIAFALVFFTGLPWYPPALVIAIGILTLAYAIEIRVNDTNGQRQRSIYVHWPKVISVIFAFILTLGLGAVTTLTLWNTRQNIGGSQIIFDYRANLGVVISQFFSGIKETSNPEKFPDGNAYAFYSFVSPVWFVLLIAVLLLIIFVVYRKRMMLPWRPVIASGVMFVFFTLWGAGQNPLIELSYQVIPFAAQFRHVERALAIASLALIILIAIVVDCLWHYLVRSPMWNEPHRFAKLVTRYRLHSLAAVVIVISSGLASYQVIDKWHESWGSFFVRPEDQWEDYCITWLRRQYPNRPLTVWTLNYQNVYTYYRNEVRHGYVGSDFYHAQPIPSTIYLSNLIPRSDFPPELLPEFAIGLPHYDEKWLTDHGYTPVQESANPFQNNIPCLYRRDGAYSYAYWVTRQDLTANPDILPVSVTTPVTTFMRDYDRIALMADSKLDADVVVTVQELASAGWQVWIDDNVAHLESVGGQIGVVLPRDGKQHLIFFQYLPLDFFLGAIITLITAAMCILYIIFGERFLPDNLAERFMSQIAEAWDLRKPDTMNHGK